MQLKLSLLLIATFVIDSIWSKDCSKLKSNTKLFCYYGDIPESDSFCQCTHLVFPESTELKLLEKIRKQNTDVKILLTVSEFNEKLVNLLKGTKVDGLELNLRKIDSKDDLTDFISTVKSKLGSDHYIAVSVPSKTETLAKNYDFKELSKHADVFILNTAFLGASQNVTFHPSRLSGLWDMQNTDSMVDLVSGLGAPLSKIVITAPVQAFSFNLQNEKYTAPGSPATEVKSITRKELCDLMTQKDVEWTLERDQDQAGPYIFRGKQWIAFEDETSIDIKTKYARVRGLSGFALKDLSQDAETKCGSSILDAAFKGLSKQARAPRAAVLHTLERDILSTASPRTNSVHDSPFRISRIIDTEGKIHVVRQDTRTEFECSRQGYFVHPRSCNRFYRCVKFDQRTEDYNVFEFDCPAGLTFDEKTEVCVWPGSLPHASACSGSSEIAPVPQKRFTCPTEPGYYADPENCRWFFACLDHGEPSMQAYEFRCPFGLVFDEEKLLCEWPWLVSRCGGSKTVTLNYYGGISNNINQYDGLGVLQTVKLGGLHGPIQAAEAKTYSNVGFIGHTDKSLNDDHIFSENSARFIDASKRLGLSLKATQSLYNAGLLSEKLAAIGLSQRDFSTDGLASEVNAGLYQNSANIGAKINGIGLGVSNLYEINQNRGYEQAGQNQHISFQNEHNVNSGFGYTSSDIGGSISENSKGGQLIISRPENTNYYQQGSSGQTQGNENVYINDHSSHGALSLGQQNFNQVLVQQENARTGVQYVQDFKLSPVENKNSQGYVSFVQNFGNDQGGINLKQNVADLRGEQVNSGKLNIVDELGYQQSSANSGAKDLSGNYFISSQNLRQETQLNSGTRQSQEDLLKPVTDSSGSTGYSSRYLNLGHSSSLQQNDQQAINKINVNQGQSDLNQHQYLTTQSRTSDRDQDIEQIKLGLKAYRENIGHLLQNVEINGAAGTYINDNRESNLNLGLDSSDFTQVTPSSVSHTTARSFESIMSATPLKTNGNDEQGSLVGDVGILHSINNLEASRDYNKYEENNDAKKATSYQFVQQPVFISSTPSSVLLQQGSDEFSNTKYSSGSSSVRYENNPQLSSGFAQQQFVNVAPLTKTHGVIIDRARTPEVDSAELTFNQQVSPTPSSIVIQSSGRLSNTGSSGVSQLKFVNSAPRIETNEVRIDGIKTTGAAPEGVSFINQVSSASLSRQQDNGSGQRYSEDGGYTYTQPAVSFEEKPQTLIQKEKTPSSSTSYSYSNRDDTVLIDRVRTPGVTFSQQVGPTSPTIFIQQGSVKPSYTKLSSGLSSTRYETEPQLLSGVSQTQFVNLTPRTETQEVRIDGITTSGVRNQVPSGQRYSEDGGYTYAKPAVSFEEKPQIQKLPSSSTSYSYTNRAETSNNHETQQQRVLQLSHNIPPSVITNSYTSYSNQRVADVTRIVPQVVSTHSYVKPETSNVGATSYNYLNQNQQRITQQPLFLKKSEQNYQENRYAIPEQPKVVLKTPNTVTETYSYFNPTVRSQISHNQHLITAVQPAQTNILVDNGGYKYDRPAVVFQEVAKSPVEQTVQLRKQYKTPIPQRPEFTNYQYKQPISRRPDFISYQFPQPVVQQPSGFTKTKLQEEAVKSYSYSNAGKTQYVSRPATIVSTSYQAPIIKSEQVEFKGYGYPKPQVQFVEEPKAVVTQYENKEPVVETPVVAKKAYVLGNSFQYERVVPKVQFLEKTTVYNTPKPTFISTVNSLVSNKINPSPQREYIYYDSRLDNKQNQYSQVSPLKTVSKATLRFETEKSYQYPKTVPSVQQETQPQFVINSTPRPTFASTIQSVISQKLEPLEGQFITTPTAQIKYLESTTLKPLSRVTSSFSSNQQIADVEINGYLNRKPEIRNYQYNQNENIKQLQTIQVEKYENQQDLQPIRGKTTFVEIQKSVPNARDFFYHDSRYTSTQSPRINYVEKSTLGPIIQKNTRVEFQGYKYPKPEFNFEEGQITGYENKEPVVEIPVVPKRTYVTTEQRYNYEDNSDNREQTVKPIVLENYVASNYQKQYTNSRSEQIDYVTPKATNVPTTVPVLAKTPTVSQEFTFYDSRLSSTPRTRVISEEVKTQISQGYTYDKPRIQLSEEPQQLFTTVQENKDNQQVVLENYVSPDYKKYDEPIQSSTPAVILSQNVGQEVKRYQNKQKSEYLQISEAPEGNLKETPVNIVQKLEQEQPIQPFYFYDSRLTTKKPSIEIVQEEIEPSQEYRQEVSSYDSRHSSTASSARLKSQSSVAIVEEEQPIQATTARQRYTLDKSTEKLGIKYAEVESEEPSSTYAPIRKRIRVSKPSRKYLPTSSTPSPKYLPSTTSEPIQEEYSVESSSEAIGGISVENYENFELVRKKARPVKVVKIVRPRVKAVVVKKNDFNPFLSAKLGAQCTCTSNTVELRREPLRIEVTDEDDDDESEDSILIEKKNGNAIVVENYESERTEGSTIEPEIYYKSSTVEVPSSTYRSKKLNRGKTRAQNVVIENISSRRRSKVNIEASDVNIVASRVRVKTPTVEIETEDNANVNIESKYSRKKTVEVEKEEKSEVSSRTFDRYGPGGLRSNAETLQGIDCQRAGLFRHPTQCNKFYSCRWDCKKNKFTLHVFNCPVHLTFDNNLGACNWPSQGPACLENTLLPSE